MSSKLDYLKKYLSSDKVKKSKKKKKDKESRIKIIDDSEVASNNVDADDLLEFAGEDAPQIVNMEEFKAAAEEKKNAFVKTNWQNLSEDPKNLKNVKPNKLSNDYKEGEHQLSSDLSPKKRKATSKNINYDSDLSPERISSNKRTYSDASNPQKERSPQRTADSTIDSDLSPQRISRRRNSDLSPKRKRASHVDDDGSARVNKHKPRERRNSQTRNLSPKRKTSRFNPVSSPSRQNYDDDNSPPRRSRNPDKREYKRRSSSSRSPVQRRSYKNMKDSDASKNSTKRLGLQDSSTLKNESRNLKEQQDEMMQNLYEKSNNDEPNVRKYSRYNNRLKNDPQKELELQKKLEIYRKWGKGLKQIEDYKSKQIDEINTGSKPLARYSNDQDLEEMLKNTERAGDPMLEYLRKSKSNKNPEHSIPIYKGPMPQNRFNIRPGYRWDGVDRSSGYEKKLFDVKNQRIAIQEEAYKYSTEDM